jgi:hypothetical protein
MNEEGPPSAVSAAGFGGTGQPVNRSAAGLEYQKFQGETSATGQALGRGLRTVFSAPVQSPFRGGGQGPRALSGAQFGNGYAHSVAGEPEEEE